MRDRILSPVLAFNIFWCVAASTGVEAASIGGGSLAAAKLADPDDRPMVFAAKWRHSSSAAILTCNKIWKQSEREQCLGNMHHPHGVPPKHRVPPKR